MVDLQATTVMRKGPASNHKCSLRKSHASPSPSPIKKHCQIAQISYSSSEEEEAAVPFTPSSVHPLSTETLQLVLLKRYCSPSKEALWSSFSLPKCRQLASSTHLVPPATWALPLLPLHLVCSCMADDALNCPPSTITRSGFLLTSQRQ